MNSGSPDFESKSDEHLEPAGHLWLVYLFFRPRLFFRHFVVDSRPLLTALCAWILGMAGVIDRIDTQMLGGRTSHFSQSWTSYWTFVVLGGVLAGAIYLGIGGWWFRVRLLWAGAIEPDVPLSRRVYIFASQVLCLPIMVLAMYESSRFASPVAAANDEGSWAYLLIVIFPFWSVWTSYVGVGTAFNVRPRSSKIWFLILPAVFYGVVFVGAFAIGAYVALGPADIDNPQVYEGPTMRFSYPGNWWIDTDDEDYDPAANVTVEPMQDALVRFMIYESEDNPDIELNATIESFQQDSANWVEGTEFSTWGPHEGIGRSARADLSGEGYAFFFFIAKDSPGRYLEVCEIYPIEEKSDVYPGIELIRSTFTLKETSK